LIGVFDSGFGGLVVLKEFLTVLPQYDYLYLGDNARIPYGTRSDRVVIRFTEQAVDFLFRQGCRLIILACHTASAKALRTIQQGYLVQHYPARRVLGVLIPTVEEALAASPQKRIGSSAPKAPFPPVLLKSNCTSWTPRSRCFSRPAPCWFPSSKRGSRTGKAPP
jgi:glutamate racemase